MTLKLLQLNILQGIFLDRIVEFVQKNQIDFLHLQEVSGGKWSKGGSNVYPQKKLTPPINKKALGVDCFKELKSLLGFKGEIIIPNIYVNDDVSYLGNATLFKPEFNLIKKEEVWLKDFFKIGENFTDLPKLSRAALICKFNIGSKELTTINAHLTWGETPEDKPYKIEQAQKLHDAIENLPKPYILSGDFNVTPNTQTASMFNDLGENLTLFNNIGNTLNPRIHLAKTLFPPGLAVDYVFTSFDLNVKSFRLVDEIDLSDHFGLLLEFEI